MKDYQLIIAGGGPAGLTAAIYAGRARLSALLIDRELLGGQITVSPSLENYPGFPDGISGAAVAELMEKQARKFGTEIVSGEVTGLKVEAGRKTVRTYDGDYGATAVIIAGGARRVDLGAPGEKEFNGKGVFYCATCDAPLFNNKAVAVVGGGNAAIAEALFMAKFASSVKVVHRRGQLRADRILEEQARAEPKLEFILESVVRRISGDAFVREVELEQVRTGEKSRLPVQGVLIAVGTTPNTDYLKGVLALDEAGYIVTNEMMATSVPGIFAAGDIRHNSIRQVASAVGDGAVAAVSAERYISDQSRAH